LFIAFLVPRGSNTIVPRNAPTNANRAHDFDLALTMAPPGWRFDAELLAHLYKSSGISRVKKNETKKIM
jgi:hypothetical protein